MLAKMTVATAFAMTALLGTDPAHALTPQEKCVVAKQSALAAKATADLKCHSKAVKSGLPVSPACLQKAADTLAKAIAGAELRGACGGDTAPLVAQADSLVASVLATATPPDAGCAAKKVLATANYVAAARKCFAKAATKNVSVDPFCVFKAGLKLALGFTAAEKRAPCGGDATAVQASADGFVGALAAFPMVDNGDGTITDPSTGLMWEKKSDDDGIHDKDNTYKWSVSGSDPDGSVFTEFLATLNSPPCFAGHCDWRLPNEDGRVPPFTGPLELASLRTCGPPQPDDDDTVHPCIPPAFLTACIPGCTVTSGSCTHWENHAYWSSTSDPDAEYAWMVTFIDNDWITNAQKISPFYVRAVRP